MQESHVMGHLGLTHNPYISLEPIAVRAKEEAEAAKLIEDARF